MYEGYIAETAKQPDSNRWQAPYATVAYFAGRYDVARKELEALLREHCLQSAKDICNVLLDYALKNDAVLQLRGEQDLIDDKTVFIIKINS